MTKRADQKKLSKKLTSRHGRRGQTLTDYALILVLVSIAAVGVCSMLGGQLTQLFGRVTSNVNGVVNASSSQ